ncbi:hypothetical protein ACFU9B_42350 [Streptomyces sp. NPDC057592]
MACFRVWARVRVCMEVLLLEVQAAPGNEEEAGELYRDDATVVVLRRPTA